MKRSLGLVALTFALALGCSSSSSNGGSGGSGGATAGTTAGGATVTGGASSAPGGTTVASSGGSAGGSTAAFGGSSASGGTTSAPGGSTAGGTSTASGGNTAASGGNTGTAGATGGTGTTGGKTGTGGTTGAGGTMGGTTTTGGRTSAGGTTSTGGGTGAGGAIGPVVKCTAAYTGDKRPLLTAASAACFTIKNYLAQSGSVSNPVRDDWDPSAGLPDVATYTASFTVAADGSGTHTTVQAAVTAASNAGGSERAYIQVKPGTYRELVCVKGSVPITLYGADSDASKVTIAFDNYNGKTVDTAKTNACASPSGATYGTSGSTTFFVQAAGFQAQNLTIANDFAEGSLSSNIQAVAATVQGDRAVFHNVHFVGNQDTLQVKTSGTGTIARSYFKNCAIDGDTDFIFGRGTAVFDGCTITYVSGRKLDGAHLAPSTEGANPFGFLIINSRILGGSGVPDSGTTTLGRAWDDSSGVEPNGQAVIRETQIGGHVKVATPWAAAATTSRAFSADGNRLYEFQNTGPGAAGH